MMNEEPIVRVGILDGRPEIRGRFNGPVMINGVPRKEGTFRASHAGGLVLEGDGGQPVAVGPKGIVCQPIGDATFSLADVTIGVRFHWQREETQTFAGRLVLKPGEGHTLIAVNEIPLETYLASVISSEMSAGAPSEFLKAHAITSRSWLAAMLERLHQDIGSSGGGGHETRCEDEILCWYGREDHRHFDVCADDHCQRYQGITRMSAGNAAAAVAATRGLFLTYDSRVCDARYYKACGGMTEDFENAWEDRRIPYLTSISDGPKPFVPVRTEAEARSWIASRPDAYCNTADKALLARILPDFDRETADFFRWKVTYSREQLEGILRNKSGIDFGVLQEMVPLERGPSGRIVRLRIEGSLRSVVVGKELEIRRWLSESHLYSSAFVVTVVRDASENPTSFTFEGAGWGHGVGLCQIGAAVMADRGFSADEILRHYFPAAALQQLY